MMRAKVDRQKMWCAFRTFKTFFEAQIIEACDVTMASLLKYIFMLRSHGYMIRHEDGGYELVRDTGSLAPIERSGALIDPNMATRIEDESQRLWKTILWMKNWDCYSLAANAQVKYSTAFRYSRCLATWEYAKCKKRDARSRDSRDLYHLIRETGCDAPLFPENSEVFDPNLFLQELWAKSKKSRRKRA